MHLTFVNDIRYVMATLDVLGLFQEYYHYHHDLAKPTMPRMMVIEVLHEDIINGF